LNNFGFWLYQTAIKPALEGIIASIFDLENGYFSAICDLGNYYTIIGIKAEIRIGIIMCYPHTEHGFGGMRP